MNLAEWLRRAALRWPDAPALLAGTEVVANYRAFDRRAAAIGAALRDRGVVPGDRVALFVTNRTDYLEALYGAWYAGAAVVPINAKLHPREAAWIIGNAEARVVFSVPKMGLAELIAEGTARVIDMDGAEFAAMRAQDGPTAPVDMTPDAMAWLFYTSGTTGKPKGVMISAGNLQTMTLGYFADVDEVLHEDAILYAAPMSHGAGLYNFMHVIRGARHVVPPSGGFDADEVLDLAPRLGNVSMFAAPTMVRRLVDRAAARGLDGEGIRTVVYGGGPMYTADIIEAVERMGPRFVQIYGQGEAPMAITVLPRALVADRSHPRWRERLASVGIAQSGCRIRVLDPEGRDVPPGETGEIAVAGSLVMPGYWNNPEATARAIPDGWLRTGDMGALDAEGFLVLRDRSKDVIISGGTNIYPREVEEALLTHPAVHEVAVVGRPHPEWGEEVVAFVALVPGQQVEAAALDAHCLERIARFKRPKEYRFLPELPKSDQGKILKKTLREELT